MLRKILITGAASLVLSAGMAVAQMSPYPGGANEVGPAAGEAPTTTLPFGPTPAWIREMKTPGTFPSAANEAPVYGEAPTTSIDRTAVGASSSEGAGGQVGPAVPRRMILLDN